MKTEKQVQIAQLLRALSAGDEARLTAAERMVSSRTGNRLSSRAARSAFRAARDKIKQTEGKLCQVLGIRSFLGRSELMSVACKALGIPDCPRGEYWDANSHHPANCDISDTNLGDLRNTWLKLLD